MVRPGRELLSGTVEVDETLVGGTHVGKRGLRSRRRELVLVAVEDQGKTGIGHIRLSTFLTHQGQRLKKPLLNLSHQRVQLGLMGGEVQFAKTKRLQPYSGEAYRARARR